MFKAEWVAGLVGVGCKTSVGAQEFNGGNGSAGRVVATESTRQGGGSQRVHGGNVGGATRVGTRRPKQPDAPSGHQGPGGRQKSSMTPSKEPAGKHQQHPKRTGNEGGGVGGGQGLRRGPQPPERPAPKNSAA